MMNSRNMDRHHIARFDYLQGPHKDFSVAHNTPMNVHDRISRNLREWMRASITLDTLMRVAARASVGYGTVRRARNGDGNVTAEHLQAIAEAFGRDIVDLLSLPEDHGRIAEPVKDYCVTPDEDEQILVKGFRDADQSVKITLLHIASTATELKRKTRRLGNGS